MAYIWLHKVWEICCCKNYNIYKASKLVNEWNVLVEILCYQTNTCGGKYISLFKVIIGGLYQESMI